MSGPNTPPEAPEAPEADLEHHRRRRQEEERRECLKSMDAEVTDLDHPNARSNLDELVRLQGSRTVGVLDVESTWRGNLVAHQDCVYRKASRLSVPFPVELRRDDDHGELWVRVESASSSRPGLREPWADSSTAHSGAPWRLLYALNVGAGRDDEVTRSVVRQAART